MILQSKKEIAACCNKKRLTTWLNGNKTPVQFKNLETYHKFLYPVLQLDLDTKPDIIQDRKNLANYYADILGQYTPEEDGNIHLPFNYLQLTRVIKKVFSMHVGAA